MPISNILIQNNIFRNLDLGIEFLTDKTSIALDNIDIVNNSFLDMEQNGVLIESGFTVTNSKIINNALDGESSTGTGIEVGDYSTGTLDYNIVFGFTTAYDITGSVSVGGNSLTSDPKFISATDLSTQLDSPCVDAGVGNGTHSEVPTDDYRNIPRVQDVTGVTNVDDGTDIGAYEKLVMYVDPNGSETAPYDSIAKAAHDFFELFLQSSFGPLNPAMTIMPGDIVEVSSLNGNISEPFAGSVYYDIAECIIRSYPGNSVRPTVDLGASLAYMVNSTKLSGIDFIKDGSAPGPTAPNFISMSVTQNGLEITDCGFIIVNPESGTDYAGPGCFMITQACTGLKIINNVIIGNGDAGLTMTGACPNAKIMNNTFDCLYSTPPDNLNGINIDNTADKSAGTKVVNNIVYIGTSSHYGINITGVDLPDQDYNCIFGAAAGEYNGVATQGTNNIHADPLFVNLAGADVKLASNSPCLDAGAGVGTYADVPTTDIRGTARPQDLGWGNVDDGTDIGAYEMDDTEVSFSSFSSNSSLSSLSSFSSASSESSVSSSLSSSSDSSFSSEFLNYGSEVVPSLIDISGGDVPVISTISVAKLLGFPSVAANSNFDDSAKWNTVTVIYEHANGQNKKFVHREDAGSWTTSGIFTTFANSGEWLKNRIILTDKEGDVLVVGRSEIGNDEDLTVTT